MLVDEGGRWTGDSRVNDLEILLEFFLERDNTLRNGSCFLEGRGKLERIRRPWPRVKIAERGTATRIYIS